MTTSTAERIAAAVAAGKAREAVDLLAAERPPIDPALAVVAAEAYAAVGRERREAALLVLAARRHGADRTLALQAARALLRRGLHRRAARVLGPHDAPVLAAIADRRPIPAATTTPTTDLQDEIDRALATATPSAALAALLERAPTSARLRVALAARALDEGRGADARAILRAGLQEREDARLELALATVAVATGTWDEAAVVIARARSRFPRLARDPSLTLLLGLVTLATERRDDALSVLHGGGAGGPTGALQALLAPTATAKPTTATPAATSGAARPMSALMQETLARAAKQPTPAVGGSAGPGFIHEGAPSAPASVGPPSPAPPAPPAPPEGSGAVQRPAPLAPPAASEAGGAVRRPAPAATKPAAPTEPSGAVRRPATTAPATKADTGGAPRTEPPTFRRLEYAPVDRSSGRSLALALAVVLVGLGVVLGPKLWVRPATTDDGTAGQTAFAQQLGRCGLKVAPWVDVDVAPASLAAALAHSGWDGRPASVDGDTVPVDTMLQPGVKLLPLRTGAALEPGLVVTPAGDRSLGLGWTVATTERPPVTSLVGALKFDRAIPWSCPQAGPAGSCVVGTARCEALVIRVQAICAGPTTASLLSRCALDAAVVGPAALLPAANATPPMPSTGSSLSGTDAVVSAP